MIKYSMVFYEPRNTKLPSHASLVECQRMYYWDPRHTNESAQLLSTLSVCGLWQGTGQYTCGSHIKYLEHYQFQDRGKANRQGNSSQQCARITDNVYVHDYQTLIPPLTFCDGGYKMGGGRGEGGIFTKKSK